MYRGFNLKEFWNNGELPGSRWLTQISRWICNLHSSDGTVSIIPYENGIDIKVNTSKVGVGNGCELALITAQTAGASSCTGSIYANGPNQTATQSGATIHLTQSPAVVPPASTRWILVVKRIGTSPVEWDAIPERIGTDHEDIARPPTITNGVLACQQTALTLNYNTNGEFIPDATDVGSPTSIIDFSGDGLDLSSSAPPVLSVSLGTNTESMARSVSLSGNGQLQCLQSTLALDFATGGGLIPEATDNANADQIVKLDGDGLELTTATVPVLKVRIDTSYVDLPSAVHFVNGDLHYHTKPVSLVFAGGILKLSLGTESAAIAIDTAEVCP